MGSFKNVKQEGAIYHGTIYYSIVSMVPKSAIAFVLGTRPEGFGSKTDPISRETSADALVYM
jgi:hypothetical protein